MKKICEINNLASITKTNEFPWLHSNTKKRRINPQWVQRHFNPAQQNLLNNVEYTVRPHPRNSSTLELFIDEKSLTQSQWTWIQLLFGSEK